MENSIKKNLTNVVALLILILLVVSIVFLAVNQKKIGFIDNQAALDSSDKMMQIKTELQQELNKAQANIDSLQNDINTARKKFIDDSNKLNSKEKEELKKEIAEKEKKHNEFVLAVRKKLPELERQMMEPLIQEFTQKIRQYGEEHGYDIIFGATASGNIVYGKKGKNITADVIEYINNTFYDKEKDEKGDESKEIKEIKSKSNDQKSNE